MRLGSRRLSTRPAASFSVRASKFRACCPQSAIRRVYCNRQNLSKEDFIRAAKGPGPSAAQATSAGPCRRGGHPAALGDARVAGYSGSVAEQPRDAVEEGRAIEGDEPLARFGQRVYSAVPAAPARFRSDLGGPGQICDKCSPNGRPAGLQ